MDSYRLPYAWGLTCLLHALLPNYCGYSCYCYGYYLLHLQWLLLLHNYYLHNCYSTTTAFIWKLHFASFWQFIELKLLSRVSCSWCVDAFLCAWKTCRFTLKNREVWLPVFFAYSVVKENHRKSRGFWEQHAYSEEPQISYNKSIS